MKAEELRIGNLVWDDYSGEMIVFGIIDGGINPRVELRKSKTLPAGSYAVDKTQSIPLTEEWLLKFGFDKFDSYEPGIGLKIVTLFEKDNVHIMYSRNEFDYVRREYDGGTGEPFEYVIEITCVHKLQNLYFALTGEELKLQP